MRKLTFANGQYYHIYNRGVDKRDVFLDWKDYARFIKSMRYFNLINPIGSLYDFEKARRHSCPTSLKDVGQLVELICYCLNPNHFHFLIKQLVDGGISEFMKRMGGGYTRYYNIRYQRSGSLFQGRFKAAEIRSEEHLINLSVYINTNPKIHGLIKNASKYSWCSYLDYLGLRDGTMCNKAEILGSFKNIREYKEYANREAREIANDKRMQKYWLENI